MSLKRGRSKTKVSKELTLWAEDSQDRACRALGLFLPGCKITASPDKTALISASENDALPKEGYTLNIKDGKVAIGYRTYSGLRNALATLSLLVTETEDCLILPDTEIADEPVLAHRGVMLDIARGTVPIGTLFDDMVLIAKSRYNILHLHISDAKGVAIEMDSFPEEYRIADYYTKSQVRELVELARDLALEIIPEFDMPAHSTRLNTILPELSCDTDATPKYLWTVCAGEEKVYELYRKVIREVAEIFPDGRYIHIGGDELEFSDFPPERRRICHWAECRKCKKKMEEEGLSDRQELYYYFANRMNGYVKECGKQTVMWSDQIDCTRPLGMSLDILMQFWRVAAPGRGPHEGCSLQGQLDLGYQVINSNHPSTYVDEEHYMSSEKLGSWRWDRVPEIKEESRRQIVGSEICAWEYGNREMFRHYDHSLPSAIVLAADKYWCGEDRVYGKAESVALTRAVLGARTPEGLDVFEAFGDIYPRRTDEPCYIDKIKCGEDEINKIISALSNEELFLGGDKTRAEIYLKGAKHALELVRNKTSQ